MDARREAADLLRLVRQAGSPARAAAAKAYMKSDLEFSGTTVPELRRMAAAWLRTHRSIDGGQLRKVAQGLWALRLFEARLLATILLQRRSKLLEPGDLPWLEEFVRGCRGWALMDNLAPFAVDDVLSQSPGLEASTLKRWSQDDDFWMRRAALLTMHRRLARGDGDWGLWTELAAQHLEDQERWRSEAPSPEERFFIRKALGWVLRERGKVNPGQTVEFLDEHAGRLSGLTVREAQRHLGRPVPARRTSRAGRAARTP
jgi:3-methyladenine DNA glycosylase AlkD